MLETFAWKVPHNLLRDVKFCISTLLSKNDSIQELLKSRLKDQKYSFILKFGNLKTIININWTKTQLHWIKKQN